jgi:hypothetical protein
MRGCCDGLYVSRKCCENVFHTMSSQLVLKGFRTTAESVPVIQSHAGLFLTLPPRIADSCTDAARYHISPESAHTILKHNAD